MAQDTPIGKRILGVVIWKRRIIQFLPDNSASINWTNWAMEKTHLNIKSTLQLFFQHVQVNGIKLSYSYYLFAFYFDQM